MSRPRIQPKKFYGTVEFTGLAEAIVQRELFEGVHYYPPSYIYGTNGSYHHACGPRGGKYRILKKGTCSKCKKMIGPQKKLDVIRGLKALTSKEETGPDHFSDNLNQAIKQAIAANQAHFLTSIYNDAKT